MLKMSAFSVKTDGVIHSTLFQSTPQWIHFVTNLILVMGVQNLSKSICQLLTKVCCHVFWCLTVYTHTCV